MEFDWSRYAVGGAQRPDSFSGLNADFSSALSQMLMAADADLGPNALSITSAYRSPEKQAELYNAALEKYGSPAAARKWVAPPGRSMHNKGMAVDFGAAGGGLLRDPNSREAQWLKANAARFGLDVPMAWEPWQVELAGARGGASKPAATQPSQTMTTSTRGTVPMMQEEQRPQGLLGALGIQKRDERAGGETALPFYQRGQFQDTMGNLAAAFNTMRLEPDQNIPKIVAAGQQRRAQEKMQNRTVEWLASQPGGERFAELAKVAGPQAALQAYQDAMKPKDDRTSMMKNYEFFISKGMSPEEAMGAVRSGTNITMPGAPTIGTIPQGYQAIQDPETEAYRLEAIPGGPAAIEAQHAAEAEAQRQAKLGAQSGNKEAVVSSSIDNLIGQIDKGGIFNLPETGILGNALGRIGVNQEAVDFRNELSTVQANIAFDRLQQMREASKTGGALGAVSERELDLLMNAYGNINQSTSPDRLKSNLQTIKSIMTKIENDPTASSLYYGGGGSVSAPQQGGVTVGEPYQ